MERYNNPLDNEPCELYELPPSKMNELKAARNEVDKLADFILTNCPQEITQGSAADVAIDIIKKYLANLPGVA